MLGGTGLAISLLFMRAVKFKTENMSSFVWLVSTCFVALSTGRKLSCGRSVRKSASAQKVECEVIEAGVVPQSSGFMLSNPSSLCPLYV